jgi:hypothetical protein
MTFGAAAAGLATLDLTGGVVAYIPINACAAGDNVVCIVGQVR